MSADQITTINSRKYDGAIKRSWHCRLLKRNGSGLIFVGEFDSEIAHPDLGLIRRGTVSYEYYWLDRWYNIFRFHEPLGELRNYYCNINMPPTFSSGVLNYVDLDIDVLVWPDMRYTILDEDEFDENAVTFDYPWVIREKARSSLAELLSFIDAGMLPAA